MALDLRAQLLLAGGIDLSGQTTDVSCGSTHRVVYVIVKNGGMCSLTPTPLLAERGFDTKRIPNCRNENCIFQMGFFAKPRLREERGWG